MKATGIVRRIDDLGRIVIPKEIRRTMRIREGDPLEIFTSSEGEVVFKKYSPVGEIALFSNMYAEVLHKSGGLPVIICDKDHVISVAGIPKKEVIERRISPQLEETMQHQHAIDTKTSSNIRPVEGIDKYAIAGNVILFENDVYGYVLLLSPDQSVKATDLQIKLVDICATLLSKQIGE